MYLVRRMILFFYIFFPHLAIILAANHETKIPPTIEPIEESDGFNKTHVFVDYSKAFEIKKLSKIRSVELLRAGNRVYSDGTRVPSDTRRVVKTLYQPLNENRKIIAKRNICIDIKDFYVKVTFKKKKSEWEWESLITNHDPLKIIAEEYKKKSCYQRSSNKIIWDENEKKSFLFEICDPKETIPEQRKGGNSTELVIQVTLNRKLRNDTLILKNCNDGKMDENEHENDEEKDENEGKMDENDGKMDVNDKFFIVGFVLFNIIIAVSVVGVFVYWRYKKTY